MEVKYQVWINSSEEWEDEKRIFRVMTRKELIEYARPAYEKFKIKNPTKSVFYYKGHMIGCDEFKLNEKGM